MWRGEGFHPNKFQNFMKLWALLIYSLFLTTVRMGILHPRTYVQFGPAVSPILVPSLCPNLCKFFMKLCLLELFDKTSFHYFLFSQTYTRISFVVWGKRCQPTLTRRGSGQRSWAGGVRSAVIQQPSKGKRKVRITKITRVI